MIPFINNWQLSTPVDAIIFDCDGTLSAIEGIDVLAEENKVGDIVQRLTADAMGKTGINPSLYEKRLQLVQPTQAQVQALGQKYIQSLVPDVAHVIDVFLYLKKAVYIVSAGVYPAVTILAASLGLPDRHVFAVKIYFDKAGHYLRHDRDSPLIHNHGKRHIMTQLKQHHSRMVYVGDGLNDLAVYDLVTRFVGYGGIYYRENIAKQCEYYLTASSMAPLIPLALTMEEVAKMREQDRALFEKGKGLIGDSVG